MTLQGGNNSFFSGVLFVDGDLRVEAPAYLRGTIVATGSVTVLGTGGDYAEVELDVDLVNELVAKMSRYRESKSTYRPGMDPLSLNGMVLLSDGGYEAVGVTFLDSVGQVSRDWHGYAQTTRIEEVTVAPENAYDQLETAPESPGGGTVSTGSTQTPAQGGRYTRNTTYDGFSGRRRR